jgi:hypothetical protein
MLIEKPIRKFWCAPEVRNKLQVYSRVHRGRRKLPTESRQVLPGLSPEWGFTIMTPGKARGMENINGLKAPKAAIQRVVSPPSGL